MDVVALTLFPQLTTALNILYVALGLGLVIFFHELGHFALAKWCGVLVERFSIGFGPILWSWKRGDTEYALSAIPFGGYVKMLGQDDMDPSQLTTEEIAQDPRSYSAKSVPQRMWIISAGVIMNVITGLMFFAFAFRMGVQASPAVLGPVQVGTPAWHAGLEHGDRITEIGGRDVRTFTDIIRGVALSSGALEVKGVNREGREFSKTIVPDSKGTRRIIGVNPTLSLQLNDPLDTGAPTTVAGTAAEHADFQRGDVIRKIDDTPVESFADLQEYLARHADRAVDFYVARESSPQGELQAVTVKPNPFKTLGLWVPIGKVVAIAAGSPADLAGLQVKDTITHVDGVVVGKGGINPVWLPNLLAARAGQDVELKVLRPKSGADREEVTLHVMPDDKPGWIERPEVGNVPLSVPAAGFAFHLIPTVLAVDPGSPADKAGLGTGETIILKQMDLLPAEGETAGDKSAKPVEIPFGTEEDNEENFAYAFWVMQQLPDREVRLTILRNGEQSVVSLGKPVPAQWELVAGEKQPWYAPTRGIHLKPLAMTLVADNLLESISMGMTYTSNNIIDIYLTIRSLVVGRLSVKELRGPIRIAEAAYDFASMGTAELLLFLGFLSVNLAVLNFLPIPVLDGGHMVFLIWEAVARRKPSERVVIAATYFGMAFVLGLMFLVLYLDLSAIFKLGSN